MIFSSAGIDFGMAVKLYRITEAIEIEDSGSHPPINKKNHRISWSMNEWVVLLGKAVLTQFFAVVIIAPGLAALLHPF